MNKFLKLASEAATEFEKRFDYEPGTIENDLPEFGGSGKICQIQTDKDNWTGNSLPHGELSKDEYGRERISFIYNNQYHYLVYQS